MQFTMEHLNTLSADLQTNGWQLLHHQSSELRGATTIGDVVKIGIEAISPLDFTKDPKDVRSVIQQMFWVKVEHKEGEEYKGILKSGPDDPLELKDGTTFEIGDIVLFKDVHILAVR